MTRVGSKTIDLAALLGVVDDRGDLEPPGVDQLAVVGPDRRRVVDRVVLAGKLEDEVEHDRAARQSLGQLLAQVVAPLRLGLLVFEVGLSRLGPQPELDPGPVAVGVEQPVGVRRVVGQRREARRRADSEDALHRRLHLGMLAEIGAELRHVGLAGLGVGLAQLQHLEELLRRVVAERARGRREQVGLVGPLRAQLDREPARLAHGVVGVRVAAAVREPDQRRDRFAAVVRGARQLRGLAARGERPLAPDALGVEGAAARMRAVDAVGGVDQLLGKPILGHPRTVSEPWRRNALGFTPRRAG